MPTDELSTAKLTEEQKQVVAKLAAVSQPQGHGLPAGGKDPANAESEYQPFRKRPFPDEDKSF